MLKEFIAQLSKDFGLSHPLEGEEGGSYQMAFSPSLKVSVKETETHFVFYAKLGPLPEQDTNAWIEVLMKANLLGKETGGAQLGLDAEGKEMTFTRFLMGPVSYQEFHEAIEDFVNYAESWQTETKVGLTHG